MRFLLKRILLNFYFALQIFTVSMGLLCGSFSYAEKDPLKAFQNYVKEDIPSSVNKVKSSIVKLRVKKKTGTGFILENGILATNAHVILDKSNIFVNQINSGHLIQIKVFQEDQLLDVQVTSIQALDPIHDLALLNVKGSEIPPAIKKPKKKLDLTKEKLFFVGYPHGKLKAMGQKGPIEIFESKVHTEVHMPVSNSDVYGASGSPIVNQKGKVVGVLTSGSRFENKIIFSNNDFLFSLQNAEYGVQCSKNTSIKKCFQQMEDFHLKEALKGDTFAQYKLGLYYFIDSEYKKALKWLKQAAHEEFILAQHQLGSRFYILESYKESFKWLELASQNGYTTSMYLLGFMHYLGKGAPQDYKKAMKFFKAASSKKSMPSSRYNVASMYARGEGVSVNHKEAIRWHELAVESGSLKSLVKLGLYYYIGQNEVLQDYKKAIEYFKLADQHGDSDATYMLGLMYHQGEGVPQDRKKAFEYFKQAAQQGHKEARSSLNKLKNNKCIEVFNKGAHSW